MKWVSSAQHVVLYLNPPWNSGGIQGWFVDIFSRKEEESVWTVFVTSREGSVYPDGVRGDYKAPVGCRMGADSFLMKRLSGRKGEASSGSPKGVVDEGSSLDGGAVKLNLKLPCAAKSSLSESGGTPKGAVVSGREKDGTKRASACAPHGSMSVIGRRRTMEDALTVAPGELASYDFYAVYDGHGGDYVAYACRDRLHKLLSREIEEVRDGGGRIDWENAMVASFTKMDQEINDEANQVEGRSNSSLLKSMGSTAAVVVVCPDKLVVSNCGDSRAVLCRRGVALPLSRDHKVTRL